MNDQRYKYFPVSIFPYTNISGKFCVIVGYAAMELFINGVELSILDPANNRVASLGGLVQNSTISGNVGSGTTVNITNLPLTLVITRGVTMNRLLLPPQHKVTVPGINFAMQVVQCATEDDAMDLLKG